MINLQTSVYEKPAGAPALTLDRNLSDDLVISAVEQFLNGREWKATLSKFVSTNSAVFDSVPQTRYKSGE